MKAAELIQGVRKQAPLVHCITNHITIGDCANMLLAVGARPIMAEHRAEVSGIAASASALAVNLGNITDQRMEAMMIAGRAARAAGVPVVIDLVGVAVSPLRLEFAARFTAECRPAVIRGNMSELRAFCGRDSRARGIDAGPEDRLSEASLAEDAAMAAALARRTGAVISISGETDLIADGSRINLIRNGCPRLGSVTGTGCMLSAVTAAFAGTASALTQGQSLFEAAVCAAAYMGICGELAEGGLGIGSFRTALFDWAERLDGETFSRRQRLEEYPLPETILKGEPGRTPPKGGKPRLDLTLYLVTDSGGMEESAFLSAVEAACRGGVTLVQLREKDRPGREYLELARKVKRVTDRFGIPLIIDDRADIAMAVDAAGVHVGQNDMPVEAARRLLGPDKIVGATAKTVEQAVEAQGQGADYLGVGAIFPTTTKVVTKITEVSALNQICRAVKIPAVAIGGLNAENCGVLKGSPVSGIAVVSAVMKREDPAAAAKTLRRKVEELLRSDSEEG